MSYFKGEYNHHEISAYIHSDGSVSFNSPCIQEKRSWGSAEKEFSSLKAIHAALDKYDLSLRKNFANTEAYIIAGGWSETRKVEKVTVTSISTDGEAWIKTSKDERRKVRLDSLYSSGVVCQQFVQTMQRIEDDTLNALAPYQWKPEVTT